MTFPSLEYWFTGTSLFFAFSFAFGIYVSVVGLKGMVPNQYYWILMLVGLCLTLVAWWQAAQQSQDGAKTAEQLNRIAKAVGAEPEQETDLLVKAILLRLAEIEKVTARRTLTEEQATNLIDLLKPCAKWKPKVQVFHSSGNEEANKYAMDWAAVLKASGWEVSEGMMISSLIGVQIIVKQEHTNCSVTLVKALQGIGIDVTGEIKDSLEEGLIQLRIGGKE